MSDSTKLAHFRNLVSLAAADGKIEDIERITLSKIAYQQKIPLDRLDIMLKGASQYAHLIPQNNKERDKQLEDMINFALVDNEFAKAELDLIKMVGERLGFTKSEVDEMLRKNAKIAT